MENTIINPFSFIPVPPKTSSPKIPKERIEERIQEMYSDLHEEICLEDWMENNEDICMLLNEAAWKLKDAIELMDSRS